MRLPFFNKPEPAPVDVEAVARAAAREAAQEALSDPLQRLHEATGSLVERRERLPAAAYAMNDPRRFTDIQDPRVRPYSLLSTEQLRLLASTYDVLAACIAHLKDQVIKTELEIAPKDDKDKSATTQRMIRKAKEFFDTEGGLGGDEGSRLEFEGRWLDDLLVIGPCALLMKFQTVGAFFDGNPDEVLSIDSSTIRPLVTAFGFSPEEDAEVYEQYVQGHRVAGFTRKELIWRGLPIFSRSHTPYPTSAVELLAMVVMTALKTDEWNRTWLTDGNVPDFLIQVPKEWTPDQISEYGSYFDALLSGNAKMRHKAKMVPEGVHGSQQSRKDADFQTFEMWMRDRTCSLMGVNPASIGHHGQTYKDSQEIASDSTRDNRVAQLLLFRSTLYTDICRRKGWPNIKVTDKLSDAEDAKARAERHKIEIESGKKSPNECRSDDGLDPYEGGDTFFISSTVVPVERAVEPQPAVPAPLIAPEEASAAPEGASSAEREVSTRAELSRWERKCLNRLRDGRKPVCGFESSVLVPAEVALVRGMLAECETREDVAIAFESAQGMIERGEVDPLPRWAEDDIEELTILTPERAKAAAKTATPNVRAMVQAKE